MARHSRLSSVVLRVLSGAAQGSAFVFSGLTRPALVFGEGKIEEKAMNTKKRRIGIWQWGLTLILVLALAGPAAAAPTWLQLNPTPDSVYGSPPGLHEHSAVYNPTNNRMIIFAGNTWGGGLYNDVWVLTNADGLGGTPAWIKLNPSTPNGVPAPRMRQAAVYDQANNRMIIHGGHTMPGYNESYVNDTWILTNADGTGGDPVWIPLTTTGPAPVRANHKAAYDAANNRLIFGGGVDGSQTYDDVFVLTNANGLGGESASWINVNPAGSLPTWGNFGPSFGADAVGYDPASNTLVELALYVVYSSNSTTNPLRVLNLTGTPAWTDLTVSSASPSLRTSETGVYDPARNRMVIFGGSLYVSPGGFLNETWRLDHANGQGGTPQWSQLNPAGALPPARGALPSIYNPASDRMIVFGGVSWFPVITYNDVWVLTEAMGPPPVLNVSIDIKPGSEVNSINPGSQGKIAVAILSTPDFYAPEKVDLSSLTFGHTGNESSLAFCTIEDVNGDGVADVVGHFDTQATAFQKGDTQGILKGQTVDNIPISGSDSVRIVPGK
jgi:hypothetical protein